MNADDALALLPLHRPGREAGSRVQKAVRFAKNDLALSQQLAAQQEFDSRITDVVHSIVPPENLREKLRGACARPDEKPRLRTHAFNPVVLTAIAGVLLIAGFFGWTVMERMEKFEGRDAVESMLSTTSKMSGVELDPVAATSGTMGDWFYMHGFEGYAVPAEAAALPVVGGRVFHIDGYPIAQLAIDRHDSILYVFRASDFGIDIPADSPWRVIAFEGWAAALRRHDDTCSMLAFRGEKSDMRAFLATLKKP